jgi:hypothetical protein
VTPGDRHEADLVVRARFRGHGLCFLIHVENQAQPQSNFPRRMFGYFARLHESNRSRILPQVPGLGKSPKIGAGVVSRSGIGGERRASLLRGRRSSRHGAGAQGEFQRAPPAFDGQ